MYGTVLFALGIMALIASVVTGSVWLGAAAVVILVPGAVPVMSTFTPEKSLRGPECMTIAH
jgi:hypothetical protein